MSRSLRYAAAAAAGLLLTACGAGDVPGGASVEPSGAVAGGVSASAVGGALSAVATRSGSSPASRPGGAQRPPARPLEVEIFSPNYDAPGGLVAVVLTALGVGADVSPSFTVDVAGQSGECSGEPWAHRTGLSQLCWVRLPSAPGRHRISASVEIRQGDQTWRSPVAQHRIDAKGPPTAAVDTATRDRITSCGNTTEDVWLTFDDGFTSAATMRSMLDTLRRANVRGRFFATGQWATANPRMVAELRTAGHLIGNHTATHESLNAQSGAGLDSQIANGPRPDSPALMRPGFGAGAYTTRVSDAAARHGQNVCYWTVDPRDWAGPDADTIISRVMHGDHRTPPVRPGGVVLFHMTGKHTAEALPRLIAEIRAAGLILAPLR